MKLKLKPKDFLRRGEKRGVIEIFSHEHDQPLTLRFDERRFYSNVNEAPTFVLGYGTTRLLPKGNIKEDLDKEPYFNIRNLFDYSVALNNPNDWLGKIGKQEFKDRVAPVFYDVLALKGDDRVSFQDNKIKIQQYGENHDLEFNSDGYKSITALVSDIMQTLSIEKANFHNSQGIVLIDEIGNHLHPRWRMKIVSSLRKAFPNLQFIVSTHEPLCLRGMRFGEVNVLVRDFQGKIRMLDGDLLPDHNLMRVDQLLTSDLFGLINIMDEETEKSYEEYYNLLSKRKEKRSPDDLKKIEDFSGKLSSREVLGNIPQEQVLYTLIKEVYAKKFHEDGFKTILQLKDETLKEVKSLVENKKPDWL